ncbi:MAG: hypothetical protein JSS36_00820 [Proteobacteria bacterium]|nr:hypothetical protein [Pseudomonadota bacterium]
MSRIIRRDRDQTRGVRRPLALAGLGLAVALAALLALAWVWGGPRQQHDVAIALATTEVGA